ncbi:MAG: outer membrane beta-barrel protein [Pseudomonadota bacterium]
MFKKITLAAALSVPAVGACAADEPKWYAGFDLGATDVKHYPGPDASVGLFLGYQLNDFVSIEGNIRRLGDFNTGMNNYHTKVDQFGMSAVFSKPLGSSKFKVFGRLGANYVNIDTKSNRMNPHREKKLAGLYGFGLSYDITPTVSARVEVQKPYQRATNLSAALAFKF